MKKLIILIAVIIIFFIFFLLMYYLPRNYEKKYIVDKIEITEKYNKEEDYYYFNFKYKKKNFEYALSNKYINKRRLIKSIKVQEKKHVLCLIPESEYLTTYPLCYKGEDYVDYNLVDIDFSSYSKDIKKLDKEYRDLKISYLHNKTVLVWNYKGFNYLKDDEYKQINFLENDTYNLDLVAKVNNYLLIPDYDSKHTFNLIYVINLKNGDIEKWNLKYDIYFDSYIIGTDNKSVYLFDHKNEIEYELRPDIMKLRKISYKTKVDGKWESVALGELNKEIKFSEKKVYNFEVINKKLYLSYLYGKEKELLTNKKIKEIVYTDNNSVYYLVDDKLYLYTKELGEILLMNYFEWNFNYHNMIYIY